VKKSNNNQRQNSQKSKGVETMRIEPSGKSAEALNYIKKAKDLDTDEVSKIAGVAKIEMQGVMYYLRQLEQLAQGYNNNEFRFFTAALIMYTQATWEAAEKILGGELKDFYDLASSVIHIDSEVMRINKKELEKQRGTENE
jgi:hypothetical protein